MAIYSKIALLVLCCLLPTMAHGQFGGFTTVQDPWVLAQVLNQVRNSLEQINLAIRDLAQWSSLADATATVTDLEAIITEVNHVGGRISGRQQLWQSVEVLPDSVSLLATLRQQLTQACRVTAQDGLGALSILLRVPALLNRVGSLVQNLSNILGTVAGLQAASAVMSDMTGHISVLTTVTVAANEPKLCEMWSKTIMMQAMEHLQRQALQDYGVWAP